MGWVQFVCRLTVEERAVLQALAWHHRTTCTAIVRRLIMQAARDEGYEVPVQDGADKPAKQA